MSPFAHAWLSAFAFTQVVEVPIYVAALRIDGKSAERAWLRPAWARAGVAFGASALTHPVVWFVIPSLVTSGYWTMVLWAEVFAVVAEAVYFRLFRLERAFAWSLLANAASAGLGFASRALFEWP